jgi:hypothetical protein
MRKSTLCDFHLAQSDGKQVNPLLTVLYQKMMIELWDVDKISG